MSCSHYIWGTATKARRRRRRRRRRLWRCGRRLNYCGRMSPKIHLRR